jgi:hypothetical protein
MNARDLSNHLAVLLRRERDAMADFLIALARFDGEKRWRELGHTSLFYHLRRELGLSAGAAQHRKTAVELIHQFPEVEAALREGRLCLSSVCELARVVTPLNVAEVLPRFFGLSRREAEAVAASIRPAAVVPVREIVTPIQNAAGLLAQPANRDPEGTAAPSQHPVHPGETPPAGEIPQNSVHPGETAPALESPRLALRATAAGAPRDVEEPLTAELSRLHLTVSRGFMTKLQQTKDALSHSHAGATTEEILIACMELMLSRKAKQKGLVERPLETPRPSRTDHIPAPVRREVMTRSGGRCEWLFENGERCNSTDRVEFDHIQPKARGGKATARNIRAACRGHNLLSARREFGDALLDRILFDRIRRERAGESRSGRAGD